ncbi:MAG TPA: DUF4179 domain-containing protein [Bacillota bacterium]|nr:DUF4179 domain-containing protein [Bacillota bacterium]
MSGQDLYKAINAIDDKYIDEVYGSKVKRTKSLSKRKVYLVLVAAIMALALLTAGAAEVYEWDGRLSQVLGLSYDQESYVDGMWHSINETVSKNGITLTLDSVLADPNSMFVLYDLTLPESMDMDRYYEFEMHQVDGQDWYSLGGSLSGSISSGVVEVDRQNHTITYMMELSASSGDIREQKMRFSFKDLYSYRIVDDEIIDERSEDKEDFVFYSNLNYTPNVINYTPGKEVSGRHNIVKIENITITPISLTIGGRAEEGYTFWNDETNEREGSFVTGVVLKGGSRVETSGSSTSVNIFGTVSYKTMYGDIVNPEDIEVIEFFEKDSLSLNSLTYTTGAQSSLTGIKISGLIFNIGIFISIISLLISAISSLLASRSDIYLSFEKAQAKRLKKGKEYSFGQFCTSTNRALLQTAVAYTFFIIVLMFGVSWLTYLIVINWFVTMTVFINALFIGLIALLVVTLRESRKYRRQLMSQ